MLVARPRSATASLGLQLGSRLRSTTGSLSCSSARRAARVLTTVSPLLPASAGRGRLYRPALQPRQPALRPGQARRMLSASAPAPPGERTAALEALEALPSWTAGSAALQKGSLQEAELCFRNALAQVPRGSSSLAREQVFESVEQRAAVAAMWRDLGKSLSMQGKLSEAFDALRRALAAFDDKPYAPELAMTDSEYGARVSADTLEREARQAVPARIPAKLLLNMCDRQRRQAAQTAQTGSADSADRQRRQAAQTAQTGSAGRQIDRQADRRHRPTATQQTHPGPLPCFPTPAV
eukprot:SAG22_NODE_1276_length_4918_cov_1.532061_6_plen_295_part_00